MIPHKCPICIGKGRVTAGFYNTSGIGTSSSIADEPCRTCDGSGIVWEQELSDKEWPWADMFRNVPNTGIMITNDPQTPRPSGEPEENTDIHY